MFIFLGFGVLGVLFFFYIWSFDGYVFVLIVVFMFYVGVLMKLGGYGCFCVVMYLMFEGVVMWGDVFLILIIIFVVYGVFSVVV